MPRPVLIIILVLLALTGVGALFLFGDDAPEIERQSIARQRSNAKAKAKQKRIANSQSADRSNSRDDAQASEEASSITQGKEGESEVSREGGNQSASGDKSSARGGNAGDSSSSPPTPVKAKKELSSEEKRKLYRDYWRDEMRKGREGLVQSSSARPRTRSISSKASGQEGELKQGLWMRVQRPITRDEYQQGTPPPTRDQEQVVKNVDFANLEAFGAIGVHTFPDDTWRAIWTGKLLVESPRTLVFALGTDLGGAVTLNGKTILLNDQMSWYREVYAEIALGKGLYDLEITHISGPSPNEADMESSCRFLYKERWEDKELKPVPPEWLYLPDSFGKRPYITSISPRIAKTGDKITIKGSNLVKQDPSRGVQTLVAHSEFSPRFTILSKSDNEIVARVPPGATSGEIFVDHFRSAALAGLAGLDSSVSEGQSNGVHLEIDEPRGLIVMAWDMTGRGQEVPDPKETPPDVVNLMNHNFGSVGFFDGISRSLFPDLKDKPVAFLIFGEVASSYSLYRGWSMKGTNTPTLSLSDGSALGNALSSPSWVEVEVMGQKQRYTSGVKGKELVGTLETEGWEPIEFRGYFHDDAAFDLGEDLMFFDIVGASQMDQLSFDHFRPGESMPDPPSMHVTKNFATVEGTQGKDEKPNVGEDFTFLITENALKNHQEHPLSFRVDGRLAPWHRAKNAEGEETRVRILANDDYGRAQMFTLVTIRIPEGVGEGEVIAYQGYIPSKPMDIEIGDRGLVGLYYDYDKQITTIPNNYLKVPVMRRVDSHLHFASNADFKLPMPAEQFAVEWYGQILIEEASEYEFEMQSDDGGRVTIGGLVMVEHPGLRAPGRTTGGRRLSAGWHDIHIEFFENYGVENFVLKWRKLDRPLEDYDFQPEFLDIETRFLRTSYSPGVPEKYPPATD